MNKELPEKTWLMKNLRVILNFVKKKTLKVIILKSKKKLDVFFQRDIVSDIVE